MDVVRLLPARAAQGKGGGGAFLSLLVFLEAFFHAGEDLGLGLFRGWGSGLLTSFLEASPGAGGHGDGPTAAPAAGAVWGSGGGGGWPHGCAVVVVGGWVGGWVDALRRFLMRRVGDEGGRVAVCRSGANQHDRRHRWREEEVHKRAEALGVLVGGWMK